MDRRAKRRRAPAGAGIAACCLGLAAAACGGSGGGGGSGAAGDGEIVVEVTDAPWVYEIVEEAIVAVDRIETHADEDESEAWIALYDGAPIELDLLKLRNGVKRVLLRADLAAGSYSRLRLRVASASLRLENGNAYSTELGNLDLSSQDTSGFKVSVDPPIEIVDGVSHTLLLDFDLTKTFLPIPANDPLAATSFRMHPVIRAANVSASGELRGVVTTETDGAGVPVEGAVVHVLPPGATDVEDAIATTATDEDGSYAVLGLPPGEIDVLALGDGTSARLDGVPIVAGSVTTADLVLE